jgi:hypothetical protein
MSETFGGRRLGRAITGIWRSTPIRSMGGATRCSNAVSVIFWTSRPMISEACIKA